MLNISVVSTFKILLYESNDDNSALLDESRKSESEKL